LQSFLLPLLGVGAKRWQGVGHGVHFLESGADVAGGQLGVGVSHPALDHSLSEPFGIGKRGHLAA
jgi:hypothetical protein